MTSQKGLNGVQMSEVVRLGGQPHETDACGILVWAQTEGDVWWPAEALDPFHMPPGKALPADALAGMSFAHSAHNLCLRRAAFT